MIGTSFSSNAAALAKDFKVATVRLQPIVDTVTETFGQLLVTKVQANASGRPGPNAPTGDYRRSWNVRFQRSGGALTADVGTNKPQGRRLEFGFHGADSLGRNYSQPAFPHVWPAVQQIAKPYEAAIVRAVNAAVR